MALSETIDTQRANRRLVRESMSAPLLTRDHELNLARRWRHANDEKALHELIQSYMRLVISTASRFKNYGLPLSACLATSSCPSSWLLSHITTRRCPSASTKPSRSRLSPL